MTSILNLPDILIKKGIPFAIFSLPGSNKFTLVCQKTQKLFTVDILDINDYSGFVIASFNSAKTGVANIIVPDFIINEDDDTSHLADIISHFPDNGDYGFLNNFSINKNDYLDIASFLVNKLQTNDYDKIVLSRVISKTFNTPISTSSLLTELNKKYQNNFVNMFHIPSVGTWIGASPETLISCDNNFYHTQSLAGTKILTSDNDIPQWTEKELVEQEYVTNFLRKALSELSINDYSESSLHSIITGNLVHLKTELSIPCESLKGKQGKLIAALHPTPAVCGLPKADSFNIIERAEKHQRRYYTGFLGPWNMDSNSKLFVNLRCAEISDSQMNIYVGGGLTSDSIPENEYNETKHKSQAILSVVENL